MKTDTYFSMDKPQKHSKWRKPDTEGHILYNSIYIKYQK